MRRDAGELRVWDPCVRVLHWSLVLGMLATWYTVLVTGVAWHEPAGYLTLVVVALRGAWGYCGSRYARFRQFLRAPADTLRYARAVRARREPRYLGHNPLGGWMIVALLAGTAATGFTGWLFTTDRFWGREWLWRLHDALAWALAALIVLHVAGVVHTSRRQRENLVRAMVTGRKRRPSGDDVA